MIPFTSCMCPARKPFRRRGAWLLAPQKGAEVEVEENDDACFCFHPKDSVEVRKTTPAPCHYQALYISRRRSRRPVITPVDGLHLLDDTYSGIAEVLLAKCNHWSFNTFNLDVSTGGRSLPFLLVHLFQEYGFVTYFKLDVVKVWRCFNLMEAAYHRHNPYHNSVHAADVTQAMHCFLQENKFSSHLTPLEAMASIIAAVAHDLDHPGVTQAFLVATSNHLVNLYHNSSVLENHHWRTAVSCLLESGIFSHLEKEVWFDIQRQIRSLILATDITRQKEFLSRFKGYLSAQALDMKNSHYRHFALQIALKCADLCNPCRPWVISQRWSYQVCQEFYRQGTFERYLNLPLTPTFDCSRTKVPKIQTDFFQHVVIPLFETWDNFLETRLSNHLLKNLRHNYNQWQHKMQKVEQQKLADIPQDSTLPTENLHKKSTEQTHVQRPSSKICLEAYSTEELHSLTTLLSLSSTTSTVQLRKACVLRENEGPPLAPTMTHPLSLLPSEYLLPLDCEKQQTNFSPCTSDDISCDFSKSTSDCTAQNSSTLAKPKNCGSSLQTSNDVKSTENSETHHCHSSSFINTLKGSLQQKYHLLDSDKLAKDLVQQQDTKSYLSSNKSEEINTKMQNSGCSNFYHTCFHTTGKTSAAKTSLCSTKNVQRFIAPVKITASWCWHIRRSLSAERSQQSSHDFDCLLPTRKCSNSCQTCNKNSGRRGSAPAPIAWSRDNNTTQMPSLGNLLDDKRRIGGQTEGCGSTVRRWSIPLEPISS